MSILVTDRQGFRITRREVTDEGYLKVPGRVARAGIQKYLASELGLNDRHPHEVINVYRPPEEVFSPDSLGSYDNKDVTDDHPSDMVSADSFKSVSVGHAISGGSQDGEFVVVDLLVKDSTAIKAIQDGKSELSAGYMAEYVNEPGTTDSGEKYEFIQRDIRINHIALVDRARAGKEAKLFDKRRSAMGHVTLDGKNTVEVADKSTATLIQSTIDGLRKQAEDAEAKAKTAKDEAEAEKAKAEKMAEDMEEEKKKSSDAAIGERVQTVLTAMDGARKIAGDDFTSDSFDALVIQREALAKARPNVDWPNKDAAYVKAAWDMEMEKSEEEREKEKGKDSHDALSKDLEKRYTGDNGQKVGDAAYEDFLNGGSK